jgi:inward rectifier potassium channel
MAISSPRHRFHSISNSGFGSNSSVEGGRLVNPDGTGNLTKVGIPFWRRISLYHSLLRMSRNRFFLTIFLFYTAANLVFGVLYFMVGVDKLGIDGAHSATEQFLEAFFFSSQTMTTVGYGKVAPSGLLANAVASVESLLGILSFAVVTGLIYGRFSRPRAYLIFSDNVLIAPYQGGKGIMVRVASYKNNHLTDVEVQLTLALHLKEGGKTETRFFQLKPEMARINSLALSWTIVHPLNEDSPLLQFSKEDIAESKMELIVNIKAFDDHFSNLVQQRTSFLYNQVVYGARFLPMFARSHDGSDTVLDLAKINAHEMVELP